MPAAFAEGLSLRLHPQVAEGGPMNQLAAHLGLTLVLVLPLAGMGTADLPQADQAEVQWLIRRLGSESFQEREAASQALEAIGEPARQALRRALHDPDLEVRRRAVLLVESLVAGDAAREVAALQGLWILKTTEYLGEKADQDPEEDELEPLFARRRVPVEERELVEDARERRTTLAFKGDTFERRQWGCFSCGGVGHPISVKGTYSLDVGRSPKVMERWWQDHGPREETHVTYCIYTVRGDTLLMSVNIGNDPEYLPRKFSTAEDENVVLLTFKRK
jgi:hypothetical protein